MLLQILRDEFKKRQERNPQYSLRAFARSLKVHSSTLSAILNEKRTISAQQAQKISIELGMSPQDRKTVLLQAIRAQDETNPASYTELSDDVIDMVRGWEHFALLACLDLDDKGKTTELLAAKMDLPLARTEDALARLEKSELVQRKNEKWFATGKSFTTTNEIPSRALREANGEYIQKAIASLEKNSIEERDITGITMAISSKKLGMAKKMIANFRRELAEYLEAGERDEVYRLNIQLFPISTKDNL